MPVLYRGDEVYSADTPEDLERALAAGFAPAPGEAVQLTDPTSGAAYDVAPEFLRPLAERGYGVESVADTAARARQQFLDEEYGGLGGTLSTGLRAGAAGLTLGLSTLLEDQNEARLLREANPGVALGGEIVGSVLPAFFTGGAGAAGAAGRVGTALRATPAGMVARAGANIARRGAGRGLAARAGFAAGGGAFEGVLFNSGAFLGEVVIQDRELTGEAFVAEMGKGALFGGGLGGGLSLLGSLGSAATSRFAEVEAKALKLLKKTDDGVPDTSLDELLPKRKRTKKAQQRREEEFLVEADRTDEKIDTLLAVAQRQIAADTTAAPRLAKTAEELAASKARVNEWLASVKKTVGEEQRWGMPAARDARGRAYGSPIGRDFFSTGRPRVRIRGDEKFPLTLSDGSLVPAGRIRPMREVVDDVTGEVAMRPVKFPTAEAVLKEMEEGMQLLGAHEAKAAQLAGEVLESADRIPGLDLESVQKVSDDFAPYREAAARQGKPVNKPGANPVEVLLAGSELSQSLGGPRVTDVPVIGKLLGAYLAFRALGGRVGKLGKVVSRARAGATGEAAKRAASFQDRAADAVREAVKTGAKGVKRTATIVAPGARVASTVLASRLYDDGEKRTRRAPRGDSERAKALAAFDDRLQEIASAVSDPDRVRQRVAQQTPIEDQGLLEAVTGAVLRKLQYLDSVAPKDPTVPGIFKSRWEPTDAQLRDFSEAVRATEDPLSVLEDLKRGQVSPAAADALRAVYPRVFAEVQQELIDQVAEGELELPYSQRVLWSSLFDVALDPTMEAEYVASVQGRFAATEQGGQPPSPSIAKGADLASVETTRAAEIAAG